MATFSDYAAHGWKLCAIDRGSKGPTYNGWNTKPMPADAVPALDGAGLLHSLSGTACLDIDALDLARPWLAERGVELDALLDADDAVMIHSGRHGRVKLLYRMKRPLRSFMPKGSGLELRCATAGGKSMQDVLPPSIHPITKRPYEWRFGLLGDWRKLPSIPASLLALWRGLEPAQGDDNTVEAQETERPRVDLVALRKAAHRHSPDAEYPEWLKVGMQLHDGTGGAQEGFDIWCDWSRGIKRKPYPGDAVLKSHWLSFSSGKGKHVASGAALAAELPAEADEFPIEPVDAQQEALVKAVAKIEKRATDILLQRLRYVIGAEKYFDIERHKLIGSDNALEHMFTWMMPRTKAGRKNPVKELKENAKPELFVDALGFHPGEGAIFKDQLGDTFANLYRSQLAAPLEPTAAELEKIEWLFGRIDDGGYREWLLKFFGAVVQRPGIKIKSAPLIWSEKQGNGKTTLLKMIPMLLVGARYSKEVTFSLLNSDFNDYLLNAWHVNLTEFRAGTRGEREAISKKIENWIADDTISMHPKGSAGYTMPNHMFLTATSNKEDAAAIDDNDRKWAVHELHAPQFTESEQEWIYNGFLLTPRAAGVLRHYFLNIPLEGFIASAKAPETAARAQMVEASMAGDMEVLKIAWEQRTEPLNRPVVTLPDVVDHVRRHSAFRAVSTDRVCRLLRRPPIKGVDLVFDAIGKYRAMAIDSSN